MFHKFSLSPPKVPYYLMICHESTTPPSQKMTGLPKKKGATILTCVSMLKLTLLIREWIGYNCKLRGLSITSLQSRLHLGNCDVPNQNSVCISHQYSLLICNMKCRASQFGGFQSKTTQQDISSKITSIKYKGANNSCSNLDCPDYHFCFVYSAQSCTERL